MEQPGTLFAFQRRRAQKLGIPTPYTGAVAFVPVQRFGSALQTKLGRGRSRSEGHLVCWLLCLVRSGSWSDASVITFPYGGPLRKFSEREANAEPVLVPGVPKWLRDGFEEVAYAALFTAGSGPRYFDVGKLRLLEAAMRLTRLYCSPDGTGDTPERGFREFLRQAEGAVLLDILDLELQFGWVYPGTFGLNLTYGGSAYEVGVIGKEEVGPTRRNVSGLVRRLPAEVDQAVKDVVKVGKRAGEHLSKARAAIYGLHPNPTLGLDESVKAVEAAGGKVVEPNSSKITLGTMIKRLEQTPGGFSFNLRWEKGEPIAAVQDMCSLLWDTQKKFRHGTGDASALAEVPQELAESGFILAVTLTHWFGAGFIKRT